MSSTGNPSQNALPPIPRSLVSFGVELEFVVAFMMEGDADPDADKADKLPPLLRVPRAKAPRPALGDSERASYEATAYVRDQITQTLARASFPVHGGRNLPSGSTLEFMSNNIIEHAAFKVKTDPSVSELPYFQGYRWAAIEVTTPGMWDKPVYYDFMKQAIQLIVRSFRCRVNPNCGLHVHVGMGGSENRIEPETLRRFGAFTWAAAPLISMLHAPERAVMTYCKSLREISCQGRWLDGTGKDLPTKSWETLDTQNRRWARMTGRDRWLGEAYHAADDPNLVQHAALLSDRSWEEGLSLSEAYMSELRKDPSYDRIAAPGRHDLEKKTIEQIARSRPESDPPTPPMAGYGPPETDLPAPPGHPGEEGFGVGKFKSWNPADINGPPRPRYPPVHREIGHVPLRGDPRKDKHILERHSAYLDPNVLTLDHDLDNKRPSRRDVMSGVVEMLGSDFSVTMVAQLLMGGNNQKYMAYNATEYTSSRIMDLYFLNNQDKTTIEFREAGGSLKADWIADWAKICCRMIEWCRDADEGDFLRVIRLLAWAQEEGGEYDVIDLLIDIGAYGPAIAAQTRVTKEEWREGDGPMDKEKKRYLSGYELEKIGKMKAKACRVDLGDLGLNTPMAGGMRFEGLPSGGPSSGGRYATPPPQGYQVGYQVSGGDTWSSAYVIESSDEEPVTRGRTLTVANPESDSDSSGEEPAPQRVPRLANNDAGDSSSDEKPAAQV